jgi:two-component system nitrogen regulation response regulator NtrX
MIIGENGVGKTEIAKFYYSLVKKQDKFRPFFRLKCSTIQRDNFNDLFFSTGAKKGIFEISNNSVILLEEIKDLSKDVQSLLLPLLRDSSLILSNGSTRENRIILIVTSSADLKKQVEAGSFDEDLYYELLSLHFKVKPLRERRSDVAPLIKQFTEEFSKKSQAHLPSIPDKIVEMFMDYDWPGNISELRCVLEKLFILGIEDGEFNINELPESMLSKKYSIKSSLPDDGNVAELWKEIVYGSQSYQERVVICRKVIIEECLKKNEYSVIKTAQELKRSKTTLYREINELGIKISE